MKQSVTNNFVYLNSLNVNFSDTLKISVTAKYQLGQESIWVSGAITAISLQPTRQTILVCAQIVQNTLIANFHSTQGKFHLRYQHIGHETMFTRTALVWISA